jgi:Putative zinc-finger
MRWAGGKPLVCQSWSEERVERYFLNLLSVEENQSFERHVLRCTHCQERIEDEVNSLLALRRAAQIQQRHVDDQRGPMRFAYAL